MRYLPPETLDFGITCIDTGLGRPGLAGCYLMEQQDRLAIIETGTSHTVPRILQLIEDKGYRKEQVDYVIITHVHLDHAGGAGGLMAALPCAKLVVHPRGARHMADPGKLKAGAIAVYGEAGYQAQYGQLTPVPRQRMMIAEDGDRLMLADRPLQFFDTPGHARHHFCVYDQLSRGIFTGDTLGIVYRELSKGFGSFVLPATTPVQFDPEALKASIDRLMKLAPDRFFLTHFSEVGETRSHAEQLLQHIDQYVVIAKRHRSDAKRQEKIAESLTAYTLSCLQESGSPLPVDERQRLIAIDMALNAQGLEVWLQQLGTEATSNSARPS